MREWTAGHFARCGLLQNFPNLAELFRKRGERGPQKAPTKQQVTLRLDKDVVERFRATGAGWQAGSTGTSQSAGRVKPLRG